MPGAAYRVVVDEDLAADPGEHGPARTLDDPALALRIARGPDREAERELCRRFAGRIRLYGLRHLRDEAAALDLVQEILLLLLTRLREGGVREPDRLGSYVLGACRLAVSGWKKGARRRSELVARFGLEPSDFAPRPLPDVERLDRCLEGLGARARSVVMMTFYAEQPTDEIARELATTPGNVRIVRHRAIASLRDCMGLAAEEP